MENKVLKTAVCFNENIFGDILEQPVDVDFTLPDYCPDISKIFKCKAVARINSKGIIGNNITIDGNVCITLLYCDADNKLCSFEYIYPFNKSKEILIETDNTNLTATAKCDYINCRAVTGRKVDIHGAVSIDVKLVKCGSDEIVSDYECESIQLKRTSVPAAIPISYNEKYTVIEDEIPIGNAQPTVTGIVRYDAVPCIEETKIINGKVMVKGNVAVTILYISDGIRIPQCVKTTIPFSQLVEMRDITEICKCDMSVEVSSLEIAPFAGMNGECRKFSLNAKLLLKCESYCVNDISVVEDAFSTKFETELSKIKLPFRQICDNINEKYRITKNIEITENISSVTDIWCETVSKNVKFEDADMHLIGTVLVGMILCDENENVLFYEKSIDFEWNYKTDCANINLSADPKIEISNVGFTILNANCIEVCVDMNFSGAIYLTNDVMLINDIKIDSEKPCVKNKNVGMVICFADKNENIWNIAKKHNANIEEILKLNGFEDDIVPNKKAILIPIN